MLVELQDYLIHHQMMSTSDHFRGGCLDIIRGWIIGVERCPGRENASAELWGIVWIPRNGAIVTLAAKNGN